MSMVDRCGGCCELVTRCRCERNPVYRKLVDTKNPPELQPKNKGGWVR